MSWKKAEADAQRARRVLLEHETAYAAWRASRAGAPQDETYKTALDSWILRLGEVRHDMRDAERKAIALRTKAT